DTVREIAEHVEAGVAAFGLSIAPHAGPALSCEVFAEEPFVLACDAAHRLAVRASVGWQDLVGETLIRISLPAGNAATIDDALGDERTRFHWRYEVQRTALALDMVRAGLGLTVVPALAARAVEGVVAVPLTAPSIR